MKTKTPRTREDWRRLAERHFKPNPFAGPEAPCPAIPDRGERRQAASGFSLSAAVGTGVVAACTTTEGAAASSAMLEAGAAVEASGTESNSPGSTGVPAVVTCSCMASTTAAGDAATTSVSAVSAMAVSLAAMAVSTGAGSASTGRASAFVATSGDSTVADSAAAGAATDTEMAVSAT